MKASELNTENVVVACDDIPVTSISKDPRFWFRSGEAPSADHIDTLAKALRSGRELDPILLWRECDDTGSHTGRLIIMDGHHRTEAYYHHFETHRVDLRDAPLVPVLVHECLPMVARLVALAANTKDSKPLMPAERNNAAWRLVRDSLQWTGKNWQSQITKLQIAHASGVSTRTVQRMNKVFKLMTEAEHIPTGEWWQDNQWKVQLDDAWTPPSSEELEAMTNDAANAISKVLTDAKLKRDEDVLTVLCKVFDPWRLKQITAELWESDVLDADEEFADTSIVDRRRTARTPVGDTERPLDALLRAANDDEGSNFTYNPRRNFKGRVDTFSDDALSLD
ncbi:hypothetical protein DS906_04690 [Ruegeria sp. A3M17]|nr:hypothetical protein DS906_04690 [Ruegeria sp. A3M17]